MRAPNSRVGWVTYSHRCLRGLVDSGVLDYAEAACSLAWGIVADLKDIAEVLNNAADYDPKDVKFNKQGYGKFTTASSPQCRCSLRSGMT